MSVTFPGLLQFSDFGLLLLRLMVAAVFLDSGWNHLKNPAERSKSIGASTGFTVFLGTAEVLGSLGVALGILTQLAAIGLILLMLGAIQKKIFVWKDRKSTRLNSSHLVISYAVFCLKKKKNSSMATIHAYR